MIKIKKLDPNANIPTRNNENDAGLDLYSLYNYSIYPGQTIKVKTGIAIEIEGNSNQVGLVWDRSSMGSRGIHRLAGVIDYGYRGELLICLTNLNMVSVLESLIFTPNDHLLQEQRYFEATYKINAGDKIAQLLIQNFNKHEVSLVEDLISSERGDKGFGSSGT